METNTTLTDNLRAARCAYYAAMDAAITGAGYAQARAALRNLRYAERAMRVAQQEVPLAA